MIRYALHCDQGHDFESWFKSAEAFDALLAAGMVECSLCGSKAVHKTLMAPAVRPARNAAAANAAVNASATAETPLTTPQSQVEAALAKLRRQVEENSEYVGMNFAAEARAIHDGDRPERSIYGEAKAEDARALLEDGIAVTPLPFMPARKTN